MDAPHWVGSDTRDYGGSHPPRSVAFRYACDGLLAAVHKACIPSDWVDEMWNEADAVWFACHVAHEARRLGLLKDALDVSVLIRLDVEAGEVMTP